MGNQKIEFTLYESAASFHTVEYRMEVGRYSYSDLRRTAFERKAATGAVTYTEDGSLYVRLQQGVVLKVCDYDTPVVFVKINPRILAEEDHSYLGIFHATAENIERMYTRAGEIVQEYIPGYSLEDASLCRVDLCLNITCSQPDVLIQLIDCLKRCDWRSQYQATEFGAQTKNAREKNKHSFRILSKHFSLTVYDKLFERTQRSSLKQEHPDALLRVEFGLHDEAAIEYYLCGAAMTDREKLLFLAEHSGSILSRRLRGLFGGGVHLPLKTVRKMVDRQTGLKEKTKRRMKLLAENLSCCKSAEEAKKIFFLDLPCKVDHSRCYTKILRRFSELGIHPVPVSGGWNKPLPSLARIVDEILRCGQWTCEC